MGENIGKITQVMGPVVDVEFEQGKLPTILMTMLFAPLQWMLPMVLCAECR
jgi:F-type H+-transporting ATPase subunit beta